MAVIHFLGDVCLSASAKSTKKSCSTFKTNRCVSSISCCGLHHVRLCRNVWGYKMWLHFFSGYCSDWCRKPQEQQQELKGEKIVQQQMAKQLFRTRIEDHKELDILQGGFSGNIFTFFPKPLNSEIKMGECSVQLYQDIHFGNVRLLIQNKHACN